MSSFHNRQRSQNKLASVGAVFGPDDRAPSVVRPSTWPTSLGDRSGAPCAPALFTGVRCSLTIWDPTQSRASRRSDELRDLSVLSFPNRKLWLLESGLSLRKQTT